MADVEIKYNNATIASLSDSGTEVLETNGTYLTDDIAVEYTKPTPNLQSKSASPTTSSQTITADSGYDGLSSVTVNAMPSGTAGTPTATKGTVSSNSISVTPSVTNTSGYITGGTKTGTAVTVLASELVSGTKNVAASGTQDVTNYASISVPAGRIDNPMATKSAVSNHELTVTPSVFHVSGFISTGGTKTGNPVTVTAAELESGTKTITDNGTNIDVRGYSAVDVNVSGGGVTMVSVNVGGLNRQSRWEYGCLVDGSSTVTRDEDYNVIVSCPENSMFVVALEMMPPTGTTGTVSYQEIYGDRVDYYYAVFAGTSGGSIY